jgi:filamentous hemagglutinin
VAGTGAPMPDGGPPEDWDDGKLNTSSSKKSKKMTKNQVSDILDDKNWHKTNLKKQIVRKYGKQLKGSKNFDFYKNNRTGEVFIKGNKSSDLIKITLDKFIK